MKPAENFIQQVVLTKMKEDAFSHAMDYKTRLQEELQKNGHVQIGYLTVADEGPSHAKKFEMVVEANGKRLGRGSGNSKKSAEQNAAKEALNEISQH